ncbi:MAG: DUF6520 family protein [Algibacter sp.]
MKRNFLKNSLAAFAFTMAIVASFAFSPAQSDAAEIPGYLQQPTTCDLSPTETCDNAGIQDCTVGHINGQALLFEDVAPSGTTCVDQLKDSRQVN